MVHCPNCRMINLTPTALKGITCLQCPKCKGALFTDTSLRMQADGRLLDAIEENSGTRVSPSPLECQECHRKMERLIFPVSPDHSALFDKCGHCDRYWIQKSDMSDHLRAKPLAPTVETREAWTVGDYYYQWRLGHPFYSRWQDQELELLCDILCLVG